MQKATKKQKELVKAYAKNGGNGTKAALEVYDTKSPKRAAAIASKTLKKPQVQNELEKELRKQKITLARSLAPIAKGLIATKKEDGQTVDDIDTQLKASDRALKLLSPQQQLDISAEVKSITITLRNYGG